MSKVELKRGDYVSTKGMTEDQYHAVAKAFVESGAEQGEYPSWGWANKGYLHGFGWSLEGSLYHGDYIFGVGYWGETEGVRHLTIEQVLGEDVEQPNIQSLLKKAEKHARKAQKHEAERQKAIEQARALLPDGWELTENGVKEVDLNDPANWREGDVLEVVDADCNDGVENGDMVVHNDFQGSRAPYCKKPDGGIRAFAARRQLRFHHRP